MIIPYSIDHEATIEQFRLAVYTKYFLHRYVSEKFYRLQKDLGRNFQHAMYLLITGSFHVCSYCHSEAFNVIFYQPNGSPFKLYSTEKLTKCEKSDYTWYHYSNRSSGVVGYDFNCELGLCLCVGN